MEGNCGAIMALGKFFIPSLIGLISLTWPSLKSFCMSVTGLKSFESSYFVLKSPIRSDKKFHWVSYLVLRNSLTIMYLFLGSVIFRNDMFLLHIFLIFRTRFRTQFRTWFEHSFERGFEHGFENGFEHGFEQGFEHGFEDGFEHSFEHEFKSE